MSQEEIIKRLNEALRVAFKRQGIQLKADMAKTLGYRSPYFSGIINGKEKLTNSFLMTINNKMGINTGWVLTGEGEMLNPVADTTKQLSCMVPLVPVSAHGGSLSTFSEQVRINDCEMILSPMEGADLAITITGESMAPDFPNGSIVLIKKINTNAFIEWGKAYVLDTRNGIVVKLLVPSNNDNKVRCLSINSNPIYAPFDIDMDDIFGIYAVKVCMSRK